MKDKHLNQLTARESRRLFTDNISVGEHPACVSRSMLECFASSFKLDSLKKFSHLGLYAWMPFSSPTSALQNLCLSSPTILSTQREKKLSFQCVSYLIQCVKPAVSSSTKSSIFLCLCLVLAPGSGILWVWHRALVLSCSSVANASVRLP